MNLFAMHLFLKLVHKKPQMASFKDLKSAYWDMCLHGDRTPHGRDACEIVLRAVADGTLSGCSSPFHSLTKSVLHIAAEKCSAAIVRRLVVDLKVPSMADADKMLPMHVVALEHKNFEEALKKFKLLPVAGLAARSWLNRTPLDWHIRNLADCYGQFPDVDPPVAILQWMVQQPECPVDTQTVKLWLDQPKCYKWNNVTKILQEAVAMRIKRWTASKAAWLVAVVLVLGV